VDRPGLARKLNHAQTRAGASFYQKDAGEPRQGRADYRCCIPALAGFVGRTSTAPDAERHYSAPTRRLNPASEDGPGLGCYKNFLPMKQLVSLRLTELALPVTAPPVVPMTKPLLIACIILSLGAAVLGFLNRGKLVETSADLDNTSSQLNSTRQELQTTKAELEEKKQEITSLGSEKDTLTSELGEARNELTKAKEEIVAAQERATTAEGEITQLQQDSEAKDIRIAELEQEVSAGGSPAEPGVDLTELQARIGELETINQSLQDQNTGLTAQVAELRRKEGDRQRGLMRPGVSGTILAVNQAWNFVVLSLGDRQGVVPNAEMLVQRDGQFLGRIRVTSVEPSTSIADILVRTVPRGFTIMPGDRVVYAAARD